MNGMEDKFYLIILCLCVWDEDYCKHLNLAEAKALFFKTSEFEDKVFVAKALTTLLHIFLIKEN
jgi:hypothetical protein